MTEKGKSESSTEQKQWLLSVAAAVSQGAEE